MQEFIKRHFTALCAAFTTAIGLLVLTGWHLKNPAMLQIHSSWAPMQYNTAVCFLTCSLSLFLLDRVKLVAMYLTALVGAAISGTTFLQYVFEKDFGIDHLFQKEHFITILTSSPGRMSPVTALCFFCYEIAMLLAGRHEKFKRTL